MNRQPSLAHRVGAGASRCDLLVIGAGASGAYAVVEIAGRVAAEERGPEPISVVVVDRDDTRFGGLPYGRRSGYAPLLITPLRDFLAGPEYERLCRWLDEHRAVLFAEFRSHGGRAAADWWSRHGGAVESGDWDDLYVPRFVVGRYLEDRVEAAVAEAHGALEVEMVRDEVVALEPTSGGHRARVADGTTIDATSVVLALGTPRTRPCLRSTSALVLEDPYDPELDANVRAVVEALSARSSSTLNAPRIAIIGGNASAMEMLYLLDEFGGPVLASAGYTVLTLGGKLPPPLTPPDDSVEMSTPALDALSTERPPSAHDVYLAARADLEAAVAAGIAVTDTLSPVSGHLARLLPSLSSEERLEFAGVWGVELGRLQRRAGSEYLRSAASLEAAGRLTVIEGAFVGLVESGPTAAIEYRTAEGTLSTTEAFDLVVNCSGFARLGEPAAGALLAQLERDGVAHPTPWGRGLVVSDTFEAGPGVFVLGPYLAGNVTNGKPVWHMEHCGRIAAYAGDVAAAVAQRLTAPA
jgi:uncharacterized NAD(P)/FAD-binding protein YdhS